MRIPRGFGVPFFVWVMSTTCQSKRKICDAFVLSHFEPAFSTLARTCTERRRRGERYHLYEAIPSQNNAEQTSPLSQLDRSLSTLADEFRQAGSVDNIQRLLAQKGVEFSQDTGDGEKVMGCIANVYVQTILEENNERTIRKIQGTSDAVVSRGILSTVASLFKDANTNDVLQLDAETLAERLNLRPALSKGRNDGLASMVRTIQKQIQIKTKDEIPDSRVEKFSAEAATENIPGKAKKKVALLLSGGVDSSVSLHLLLKQGYDVTAFYLKIWLEDELSHLGTCPWEEDYETCVAVCNHAGGVPLETISLQKQYQERVIQYTVQEAQHGRTPNPDILCNSRIKFGCFLDELGKLDNGKYQYDYIATGHYARIRRDGEDGTVRLFRAPDPVKDQSYFLCALSQEQLQKCLFPIGHLQKTQVRELADEFQLPNRNRPDSQGLCFLGKVKFDQFLASYLGNRPGPIIDAATGDDLGQHNGIWYHTVGQRKGIGKVLNPLATARGPWYVVAKDPSRDTVFCSNQYDEDIFTQARSEIAVENIHWISGHVPTITSLDRDGSDVESSRKIRFTMKIRHGPRLVRGTLTLPSGTDFEGDVHLDQKDSGLAPGQYVVFYNDYEECLGGGVISEKHWAKFLVDRGTREKKLASVS